MLEPLLGITPASAAVHVLAICVRTCELASMHTSGQRVRCRLHAIVRHFTLMIHTKGYKSAAAIAAPAATIAAVTAIVFEIRAIRPVRSASADC